MAQEQPTIVEANLFSRRVEDKSLADAVKEYFEVYGEGFALLYSPKAAYLAKLESANHFTASSGKEAAPVSLVEKDWQDVFEARIFNNAAELRWLNKENGTGPAVVLCSDSSREFFGGKPEPFKTRVNGKEKDLVGAIGQRYLLWGESFGESDSTGWTKFAEARVGFFFVPIIGVKADKKGRAQLTAVEYLGEHEDGNVAVSEERLTGLAIA